jgi:hypothetical protein
VYCLAPDCGGERTFSLSDLAGFYGVGRTGGDVLRRMRRSGGCGGRAGAAWLGDRACVEQLRQAATGAADGSVGEGVGTADVDRDK